MLFISCKPNSYQVYYTQKEWKQYQSKQLLLIEFPNRSFSGATIAIFFCFPSTLPFPSLPSFFLFSLSFLDTAI